MFELIATTIIESAGKSAVRILEDALKRENAELVKSRNQRISAKLVIATSATRNSLERHVEYVRNWCAVVNFSDLSERKSVSQIYVALDTYLLPLHRHTGSKERQNVRPLLEALTSEASHCAMLGGAGAGKTTSLKKICADYFQRGKVLMNYQFPILIRLRDITESTTRIPIYEKLQELLAIRVDFSDVDGVIPSNVLDAISRRAIEGYLDGLQACILLDGFDEVSNIAVRAAILNNLENLAHALRKTKIIITSRTREFTYSGEFIHRFEIAPLSSSQISNFAHRWLKSPAEAEDFVSKIASSPFADTAIRPLTIAHLCAIYERIKDIPDKPKSVYRRITNLLLKEWDEQRLIKRTSQYADFDVDQKLEFLAHFAFELTVTIQRLQFDSEMLRTVYLAIHADHGLPKSDVEKVILEIESHNGLILQSGYDTYEFAHKSLQEFLTADYIVRLPSITRIAGSMHLLPNELAISAALSSRPGDYLCEILLRTFDYKALPSTWFSVFAARLVAEKPDLVVGRGVYTTIALLFLISNARDVKAMPALVRSLLPTNTMQVISPYYKVGVNDGSKVELVRIAEHKTLSFPRVMRIPSSWFTRRKS